MSESRHHSSRGSSPLCRRSHKTASKNKGGDTIFKNKFDDTQEVGMQYDRLIQSFYVTMIAYLFECECVCTFLQSSDRNVASEQRMEASDEFESHRQTDKGTAGG